ncbi:class I adenylate-forming enzyme family protein [Lignipirellula cremea]|uniref:Long-chain-fatty-acid--CoA ligase n=1 Tax=Lignipirellula cremea TaxID=2528010 RepID=A0A518E3I2_9BACT|nr:AMP-binding protein [Lignipirellula cremea]QDU98650.1 Long-chain-fatty-acid--CoA ligase [Lignipirellula cremea]
MDDVSQPVTIAYRPVPLHAAVLTGLPTLTTDASADVGAAREPLASHRYLADAFLATAAARPDQAAIEMGDRRYGFADLASAAMAVARRLHQQPLFQQGDCVGLLLENGPEYIAAFYGVLLAGGVATPLPPNVESARLEKIRRNCHLTLFLSDPKTVKKRREFDPAACDTIDLASPGDGEIPRVLRDPVRSPAMILFTSGSSGDPKGVMLSDANLLANSASIIEYLSIAHDERALALLPFYHAYGASVMQTHLLAGATLLIDGSLTFPETVITALAERKATSFAGVPEAYHALLQYAPLGEHPLPDLRYLTVAGGRLDPDTAVRIASQIAPAKFFVMYGQSEASARLAYLPPNELQQRSSSIGRAIPGVELAVLASDGTPAPVGVLGELCARGPNIMLGYWDSPQESTAVLADGWLHTGDLAIIDEQGYFYIKGRKNDLVKIQGHRTHPREIEEAITACAPSWRVIVTPYQRGDTMRLAMFVAPGPGETVTVDDVRKLCLRELPRPKNPSYIEILQEIPLNGALKTDRAGLAEQALAADSFAAAKRAA